MPRPTDTTPAMRRRVSSDRRQVKVLVHPPQGEFEVSVAMEVFRTKPHNYRRQHDVRLCTERPGPVTMPGGPDLQVFEGMLQLRSADIVIVAGWDPDREISPERLQRLVIGLRRAHRSGAQLVGLNTGAYLLAETGLLDGRRATIDWRLATAFARRYPAIEVDTGQMYIDHPDIATSAGGQADIDLCLRIVRRDAGDTYANAVARTISEHPDHVSARLPVTPPRRPDRTENLVPLVRKMIEGRLHERFAPDEMAARLGMSASTFTTRMERETGIPPGYWLIQERMTAARRLLEETDTSITSVATLVGLPPLQNLYRHFYRYVGMSPLEYRESVRSRGSPSVRA
ncbi:MAG TPA: helix-turn-helix domain-containing protein [Jiangellaceae bacterium]|nr:helix-turn-helix domain-containing protein [Jiangellaceae bacterium]